MNNKVYQACYTRVGHTCINDVVSTVPVSEGYQSIHCSEDLPGAVKKVFDERRMTVLSVGSKSSKKTGFSLFCENNVWGAESLRFDLRTEDRSGGGARPCLFDHTFLKEDAYEMLKEPESLVYISEDNFGTNVEQATEEEKEEFRTDIEGALRWCIRNTAAIPNELVIDVPAPADLTVQAICQKYGITEDNYQSFIKCVYQKLFLTEAKTSIYVKTDGSTGMMKDLLYLLLSVIPYSVRTRISAGEYCYEGQKGNDIYFTSHIPEGQAFIDPLTGNENVFNDKTKERFDDRFLFVTFALSLEPEARKVYFDKMEGILKKLGLGRSDNWQRQHIQLAHMLMVGRENPAYLVPILYGLLNYPVSHEIFWEKCMATAINEIVKKDITLSDEMEKQLLDVAINKTEGIYLTALLNYEASNLEKADPEKAIAALKNLCADKVKYSMIAQRLLKSEKGNALLHEFYSRRIQELKVTHGEEINLISLANTVKHVKGNRDLLDQLAEIAAENSRKELEVNGKPFIEVSKKLDEIMRFIYGEADSHSNTAAKKLRDDYHDILMSSISDKTLKEDNFKQFYKTYGKEYPDGVRFLKALDALRDKNFDYFEKYVDAQIPDTYKKRICKYLASNIKRAERNNPEYLPLRVWLKLAEGSEEIPANLMIDDRAKLIYDGDVLDHDLDSEANLWSNQLLAQTIEVVKARMKEDSNLKKQLKDSLEILKIETDLRKKKKGGLFSKLFG